MDHTEVYSSVWFFFFLIRKETENCVTKWGKHLGLLLDWKGDASSLCPQSTTIGTWTCCSSGLWKPGFGKRRAAYLWFGSDTASGCERGSARGGELFPGSCRHNLVYFTALRRCHTQTTHYGLDSCASRTP